MKKKIINSIISVGFLATLCKIILYPLNKILWLRNKAKIIKLADAESRFTRIYETNYWNSNESVSGTGSTLLYTENLRKELPFLVDKFSIKSIFDAPCGDFTWMQEFLKSNELVYVGGDIVKKLIDNLNLRRHELVCKNPPNFLHFDITKDEFPNVDLWICRDCLFHLSYQDTWLAINRFVESKIPFILTTTHSNDNFFMNRDIHSGEFKYIDLFSTPYNFPPPLYRIEDWHSPDTPREMCLWSREQILGVLNGLN